MELRPGIAPGRRRFCRPWRSLARSRSVKQSGAPGRIFTFTLPGKSRLLSKLSYGRMLENLLAAGVAPATSAFAERRSDLLSYASMLEKKWLPDVVPPHEDLVNSQA